MRFFLIVCFFVPFLLIGQDPTESPETEGDEYEYVEYISFEKYSIGITPSSFLNLFSGVQISQDFGLSEKLSFSLETGYIFSAFYVKPSSGYNIKPGLQYMFWSEGNIGLVVGANMNYRNTITQRQFIARFWQEQFSEIRVIERNKVLVGGDLMFSMIFLMNEAVKMEFGFGLGLGNLTIVDSEVLEPEFRLVRDDIGDFIDTSESGIIPIGYFHLNFSYDLVYW